ncbi:MAG: AraC family transcriptional regulator [Proteobacteria bacterium]|nr:AraC family transcriptional regulator [Pseudomonadota bacterium]
MDNDSQPAPGAAATAPRDPSLWKQRVGVLSELPHVVREMGADPAHALAAVGLAADAVDRPDQWIPFLGALALLSEAAARVKRPDLGLAVGRRFALAHIGLLGEMIQASDTIGDGLRSYIVHQRLFSQGFAPFLVERANDVQVGFVVYHPTATDLAAQHDLLLAAVVAYIRELRGAHWAPREVALPRKAPADVRPWREHFRCRLRFDADRAFVSFHAADLEHRVATANPARLAALEAKAIKLMDQNLLPLLYRSLRVLLLESEASAAALAFQFSIHERTLNRRLLAQGTNFQNVLNDVRFEVARNLLHDTSLDITAIANSLGYAETASFSKAFKRWTGTTPSEWRREAGA